MRDFIPRLRGRLFTLKCRLIRRNINIGENLRIYKKLNIQVVGKLILGNNCRIQGIIGSPHKCVCIDAMSADSEVRIGDNVTLCAARITARFGITIGDNVLIEDASILDTDFHTLDKSRGTPLDESVQKCRIRIGNNVGIGAQSFITKGVEIGDGALIAPSAVVSRSVKPGHFAYGNPAIVVDKNKCGGNNT